MSWDMISNRCISSVGATGNVLLVLVDIDVYQPWPEPVRTLPIFHVDDIVGFRDELKFLSQDTPFYGTYT